MGLPEFDSLLPAIMGWIEENILIPEMALQAGIVLGAWILMRLLAPRIQAGLRRLPERQGWGKGKEFLSTGITTIIPPFSWLILLWVGMAVAGQFGWPYPLLRIVMSLLAAWIAIRCTTLVVRDPAWAKFIAYSAWTLAALNMLNLFGPTVRLLDQMALNLGNLRISALLVLQGVFSLAILLWLAAVVSEFMERRIKKVPTLTPSLQVLISKLLRIVLITIAFVASLGIVGIDVTAFAVFTGAIGVGIGFGLQKVVSNLISGVILLLDRSVKPGDVITVGDTFGWINSLGARYVSVLTRGGQEYLIPNEDLITQQVVNWSYSNNEVRLNLPIGVAYKSDVHKAIRLCLEAAKTTPRVIHNPEPQCLLREFGDSSVNLELRIWINDPKNGIANLQSEVLLRVWDLFHANDIQIPFPQRDLHLVSPARLSVSIAPPSGEDQGHPGAEGMDPGAKEE